ncbi:MAG: putative metallopeptidase [uncultured Nocardioidaceae bacterium]|uniref:Aminopeptidase N n=1 Tax=uncultured Nocardioidaceae bacterium TaxID=253824 RepID=A0A6J4LF77_9ACTN|nr:MAG: putative metallopeptidase [uncultured Nocardioidaceae bacterium]
MSRLCAVLVALCLGVVALVGCGSASGSGPETAGSETAGSERVGRAAAGSASGGDPYFPADGNGGYDVRHYKILDTYRPGSDRLRGVTVLRATAHRNLSALNLDLVLAVDEVRVNGRPAAFRKPSRHELTVVPDRPLDAGERFRVRVSYHGRPSARSASGLEPGRDLYFRRAGETVAIGEPQIGPWWFAANETPTDKATYDIVMRVPQGKQAVSNGHLVSRRSSAGWTTWHWRMPEPMVTYLAFFAAGRYRLERGEAGGRPFVHAVSRALTAEDEDRSLRLLRATSGVVSWLESRFGPYPFSSTGGVVVGLQVGFALENQSRPVYDYSGGPDPYGMGLLVHEQAHQWFGNDVSLRRWRDIWLNEGFATYVEWLYDEDHGRATVQQHLRNAYELHGVDSGFWGLRLSDPGPSRIWREPVYVRGGMTLAALRSRIGETDMDRLLRRWVESRHFGHGTGQAFRRLASEVSGEDLDGFFAHWLDDTSKPATTAENGLG